MNKLIVLLKKELMIRKKSLLTPVWITGGLLVVSVVMGLIGLHRAGVDINFFQANFYSGTHQGWLMVLNYIANAGAISVPLFLCTIMIIAATQNALNEDSKLNCELFHRSQPVSTWQISFSKYFLSIFGNWFVLVLIAIVLAFFVNILIALKFDFIFKYAFAGMFNSLITQLKVGLIIGSIFFFFSAIFRDKVFWKVVGLIFGINVLVGLFNFFFKTHIPLPIRYLIDLIRSSSVDLDFIQGLNANNNLQKVLTINWGTLIFNWNVVLKLVISAALFAGGTLVYKFREIK